jgi:hypothetical protein
MHTSNLVGILFVFGLVLPCSTNFDIRRSTMVILVKACLAQTNTTPAYFKLLLFDVWSGHILSQCML